MYEVLKSILLPILKVPSGPPAPPPGHADGEFLKTFRAAPAYLNYRLFFWSIYAVAWSLGVLVAMVFLLFALGGWGVPLVILLVAFAVVKAGVLYVTTRLDYEMRWYILTERSLRLREGVWTIRELTLTFANVQNVHVLQGPVERIFGFSNIMLETAGGGSGQKEQRLVDPHRALLKGIENPSEVRDLILNLLRRYKTAGLGDKEDKIVHHAASGSRLGTASLGLLGEIRDAARGLRQSLVESDR
jgi:membrane protein YdbS with pleckstrin-like domain